MTELHEDFKTAIYEISIYFCAVIPFICSRQKQIAKKIANKKD